MNYVFFFLLLDYFRNAELDRVINKALGCKGVLVKFSYVVF